MVASGTGSEPRTSVPEVSTPPTVPRNLCPENNNAGLKADGRLPSGRATGSYVQADVQSLAEATLELGLLRRL